MLSLLFASLLAFAINKVWAYSETDQPDLSGGEPAAKVNTIEPGSNVIVKLDCAGCPLMVRNGFPQFGVEYDYLTPNSLVCLFYVKSVDGDYG